MNSSRVIAVILPNGFGSSLGLSLLDSPEKSRRLNLLMQHPEID
jgi:hypothetical protein